MESTWGMDFSIAEVRMGIFFYVIQPVIRCHQQHILQIWSSELKFKIDLVHSYRGINNTSNPQKHEMASTAIAPFIGKIS